MRGTVLERVILALDNMDLASAEENAKKFKDRVGTIKIGLELFCKYGPDVVKKLSDLYNAEVFLDLKLHDIPNTVEKAIKSLEGLPLKFLTIHLTGGSEMVKHAIQQANQSLPGVELLGVSYLTSLEQKDFKEIWNINPEDVSHILERVFSLALNENISGLVCSAKDLPFAQKIEEHHDHTLIKVCPGIRFREQIQSGQIQDQKRVVDPITAINNGADYLVIGRPLTQAGAKLEQRMEILKHQIQFEVN